MYMYIYIFFKSRNYVFTYPQMYSQWAWNSEKLFPWISSNFPRESSNRNESNDSQRRFCNVKLMIHVGSWANAWHFVDRLPRIPSHLSWSPHKATVDASDRRRETKRATKNLKFNDWEREQQINQYQSDDKFNQTIVSTRTSRNC